MPREVVLGLALDGLPTHAARTCMVRWTSYLGEWYIFTCVMNACTHFPGDCDLVSVFGMRFGREVGVDMCILGSLETSKCMEFGECECTPVRVRHFMLNSSCRAYLLGYWQADVWGWGIEKQCGNGEVFTVANSIGGQSWYVRLLCGSVCATACLWSISCGFLNVCDDWNRQKNLPDGSTNEKCSSDKCSNECSDMGYGSSDNSSDKCLM